MSRDNDDNSTQMNNKLAIQILEQLPTPVMAVDLDMKLIFMNQIGCRLAGKTWEEMKGLHCHEVFDSAHCNTDQCRMKQVMGGAETCTTRNEANIGGRAVPIEYTAAPLKDDAGNIIGGLEYILDITDRVQQEKKLQDQSRTIMEISTPVIKLWDRIIVLPMVGVIDSLRAQQMMKSMLKKITETLAKVIILDIAGVATVDTAVANHLIKIAKATKLMGCRCIVSGISPAVAETMVELGIELGEVTTNSTLQDSLADAFAMLKLEVTETE